GQPDDAIAVLFGGHGDVPIVGDWGGTGVDKIGVFRAQPLASDPICVGAAAAKMSCFILDLNDNRQIDPGEAFLFGAPGDVPVVGDSAPTVRGKDFGVYRPQTGEFLLDRNGARMFTPAEKDSNGNGIEDPSEAVGIPNGVLDINDGPIVFGPV